MTFLSAKPVLINKAVQILEKNVDTARYKLINPHPVLSNLEVG